MSNGFYVTLPDGSIKNCYTPTPKQAEFHSRREPNVLFWGGRGSGKSVALRWEAHARAMATPGFAYVILRKTYPELQKSHLMFIEEEMKLLGGRFLKNDKIALYPNGSKGIYSQCSSEEDVLNLLSAQFGWAGFDELSTFPWDWFTKLAASVRVSTESGLIAMVRACTNPLGAAMEEINHYFILKDVDPEDDPEYNAADWYDIKANLEDNPHIDQEQYRKRFSGLASHVRKAWLDGEFVTENALFDFYPTKRKVIDGMETDEKIPYHVINNLDMEEIVSKAQIYRAIDAGWFPDPTLCLWIAHLGNRYIVINEKLWWKHVASDIAADIRRIDENLGIKKVVTTYCDPTMDIHTTQEIRTLKDVYEANGIPMDSSINNREMFASAIHLALNEEAMPNVPRLQIYGPNCKYLVKTIPQQRFDIKKPMALANHHDDHGVVALAYFLMSHSSAEQRGLTWPKVIRPWMKLKKGDTDRFILGRENVRSRY